MFKEKLYKKMLILTVFTMVMPFAFASFSISGSAEEKAKSNKFSLKNISSYSKKSFSLNNYKTTFQYNGSFSFKTTTPSLSNVNINNTFLQFNSGNTTVIMPFKYTFKVPKFKTPTRD